MRTGWRIISSKIVQKIDFKFLISNTNATMAKRRLVGKSAIYRYKKIGVISDGMCPSQYNTQNIQNKNTSNRHTLPHFTKYL